MPWKIISLDQGRWRLVKALLQAQKSVQELSRHFGVSRKTAYKWKARFMEGGRRGLRDRPRQPRHSPRRLSPLWRKRIKVLRRRHRRWGGKKLHARLRALHAGGPVPAVRTITRWLGRWQLSRKRRRRPPKGPVMPRRKLTLGRRANAVWTVDFKGWWRTADRCRVEPLTVRDLYSRYVLAVRVLPDQQWERVQRVFLGLFRRYGLPRVIRVDNGGPFGSTGPAGLSRLSAWWVSVGLRVEFIRPAHPQDNGAHEQMHRELKGEAARPVSSTARAQQRRLERWRRGYNQVRPHEALAQQPPSRKYRRSARRYNRRALRWQYAPGWAVRRVRSNGQIRWAGRLRFVGEAFVGYRVGLRGKATGVWHVYFHHILLGELRALDRCGLRPAVYHSGRFHKGAKKPKV
ncbi:MAG TPA: leucine zipper domain-containing protein [Dongiaceae bacterium]|nr:leucine zipper domain-containing protein [Dongiaceae bacterium]